MLIFIMLLIINELLVSFSLLENFISNSILNQILQKHLQNNTDYKEPLGHITMTQL